MSESLLIASEAIKNITKASDLDCLKNALLAQRAKLVTDSIKSGRTIAETAKDLNVSIGIVANISRNMKNV